MTRPAVANVAFIGTEGSGKSVLMVTLAAAYSVPGEVFYLRSRTKATEEYTRRGIALLQGAATSPQWLPSNDPGTCKELEWEMQVGGTTRCVIHVVDGAGQDFRALFGEEQALDNATLNETQRKLLAFVRSAAVVVLAVNLEDFLVDVEPNTDRRLTSEWALRFPLDQYLAASPRTQAALLFTGSKRYEAYLKTHGTWGDVAKKYLPSVIHSSLSSGQLTVLAVSAINEVQPDPNGEAHPVPALGFTSDGLQELLQWISNAVSIHDTPNPLMREWQKVLRATGLV